MTAIVTPRNLVASVFFVFGAIACTVNTGSSSGGTNGPGQGISADSFCDTYCTRVNACDQTQDKQTCVNQCKNANSAILPKLNSDVTSAIESCVDAKDCKTVLSSSILKTCSTEAEAAIAPSAEGSAFCDHLAAADTKCGKTLNKAKCLDNVKLYNDAAISDADACTSKACSDIDSCISAAFADDLSSSGSSSSSGGSSSGGSSSGGSSSGGSSSGGTDAGTDGGGGPVSDGGGGGTCNQQITTNNATCDACLAQHCCSQDNACGNSADCRAELACVAACAANDTTCVNNCRSAHPSGDPYLVAWFQCDQSYCTSACP